jgi:hypothetical protein
LRRQLSFPGLDEVAVVGQTIQQLAGQLGIHKDARPFTEGEIGRHDDGGALVELADQIEKQLTTGLGEGEIAKFIVALRVDDRRECSTRPAPCRSPPFR